MWTSRWSSILMLSASLLGCARLSVEAADKALRSSETLYAPADCLRSAQSGDHLLM